jgi:hypothetical protein
VSAEEASLRTPAWIVLSASLLASGAVPARADKLTVSFTGMVTNVTLVDLTPFFQVGDPWTGSFRVDLASLDSKPSPTLGDYPGVSGFRFEVGGEVLTAPQAFVEVGDGEPFGGNIADFFRGAVICQAATPCAAGDLGGYFPVQLELVLADTSASTYADDSLPASLLLADFDFRYLGIGFENGVTGGLVEGSIDSLTAEVPEPAAALLLLVGAGLLLAVSPRDASSSGCRQGAPPLG